MTQVIAFRFSAEDIEHYYSEYTAWRTFVRTQEAKMAFSASQLPTGIGRFSITALPLSALSDQPCTGLVDLKFKNLFGLASTWWARTFGIIT